MNEVEETELDDNHHNVVGALLEVVVEEIKLVVDVASELLSGACRPP